MNGTKAESIPGAGQAKAHVRARRRWRIGVLLVVAFLLAAMIVVITYDPASPRFVATQRHTLRHITSLSYPYLDGRPFAGGRVWLNLVDGTNAFESVLFDLEARSVVGRIENAFPIQSDTAGTYVLCVNRVPRRISLWQRGRMLAGAGLRRLKIPPPAWLPSATGSFDTDDENFWLVDLSNGEVTFAGTLMQMRGVGTSFMFSPDFQHGLNKPSRLFGTNVFYLLEVQTKALRPVRKDGWPVGWWDNQTYLLSRSNEVLLVGLDGQERLLVGTNDVAAVLARHGLEPFEQNPNPISCWSDGQFEYFLTDTHKRWSAEESMLLKIHRPDGRLELIDPRFKFEWSDRFDESARHYLYTGRDAGDRSDAVLVRDLDTGTERTLVPSTDAPVFSQANFYGDSIIYVRSNQLWSVRIDGSTNEQLFPPSAQP